MKYNLQKYVNEKGEIKTQINPKNNASNSQNAINAQNQAQIANVEQSSENVKNVARKPLISDNIEAYSPSLRNTELVFAPTSNNLSEAAKAAKKFVELKSKSKTKEEYDKGGAIISSIVRMAQKLNFVTVAEGVEIIEQAAFLKGIGCDVIQGFLYSKPMPESAYKNLLQEKDKEFDIKLTRPVGKLNIGSFMNPTTEQYIFFENFIGPAFICEFFPSIPRINIIRINKSAKILFDFNDCPFEQINCRIQTFIQKKLGETIIQAMNKGTQTLDEVDCLFQFTNKNKEDKTINLKIWQISTNKESFAFYCSIEDITEFQK